MGTETDASGTIRSNIKERVAVSEHERECSWAPNGTLFLSCRVYIAFHDLAPPCPGRSIFDMNPSLAGKVRKLLRGVHAPDV